MDNARNISLVIDEKEETNIFTYIAVIFVGAVISHTARFIHLQEHIFAIAIGLLMGVVLTLSNEKIEANVDVDVELLSTLFIPLIILKITYSMDNFLFIKSLPQILLIAIFGSAFYVCFFGPVIFFFEDTNGSYLMPFMIAVFLAPNEFTEIPSLDGIKNLETLIYGETVFVLVIATTVNVVLLGVGNGTIFEWYHVLVTLLRYFCLPIPVGYAGGLLCASIFGQQYDDHISALCTLLASTYFMYVISLHILHCSGTLATFIALYMITIERTRLLSSTDRDVKQFIDVTYSFLQVILLIFYTAFITYLWLRDVSSAWSQVLRAIACYIISNVLRLISFLFMSPILSRIGYGYNFSSLVTMFWAVRKGVINIIPILEMKQTQGTNQTISDAFMYYTLVFVVLTYMVNGNTLQVFLRRFGLIKISNTRMTNISMGIGGINMTCNRVLTLLKLNRSNSDANWPIVFENTELKNPFEQIQSKRRNSFMQSVICHVCSTEIPVQINKAEYEAHYKEVVLRVLKSQRISFIKQHDTGFLTKFDIRILLQAIEIAMDAQKLELNLDHLWTCFEQKRSILKKIVKIMSMEKAKRPTGRIARRCFDIATSLYFHIVMQIIATIDVVTLLFWMVNYYCEHAFETIEWAAVVCVGIIAMATYLIEWTIKVMSYRMHSTRNALSFYFTASYWNRIDFAIIGLTILDSLMTMLHIFDLINMDIRLYLRWGRLIVIIKMMKIINFTFPRVLAFAEYRKDAKIMRTFTLAAGIVLSCDEIIEILPSLTRNSNIHVDVKNEMIAAKNLITHKLGWLEQKRPALTTSVKTKVAIQSTLKHILDSIQELEAAGLIDHFECTKLHRSINLQHKQLDKITTLDVIQPKMIFNEVPWLQDEDFLLEYLYSNIKTRILNAGDILYSEGNKTDGVYIIVSGYVKVTYSPCSEQLQRLKQNGELPVKEMLEYMRFDEIQEEHLTCGNRMGEFALLTERPFNCTIIAEAPSSVFIVTNDVFQIAVTHSADPVVGVVAKMWKAVLYSLARRLLQNSDRYENTNIEEIDYALHRAIVPDISGFKVISYARVAEDVLLLEGIVVDYSTREIYIAPCEIPKGVTKLIMPCSSLVKTSSHISTKLMFIPASNIDEFDMMLAIENDSDLMPNQANALQQSHAKRNRKKAWQSHLMTARMQISSGTGRYNAAPSAASAPSTTATQPPAEKAATTAVRVSQFKVIKK